MKIKELQNKSEDALKTMLKDLRDKLRDLNFKVSQKQLKKVRDVRETRKSIAQILTVLNLKKNKEDK
jgi:ribosomal protein L29